MTIEYITILYYILNISSYIDDKKLSSHIIYPNNFGLAMTGKNITQKKRNFLISV